MKCIGLKFSPASSARRRAFARRVARSFVARRALARRTSTARLLRVRASARDDARGFRIKVQEHALPPRERPSTDAQPQNAEGDAIVARALARVVRAADAAAGEAESKRHGAK